MLTQIYEIATPAEARAISAFGVGHIGILVGDGEFPRELPLGAAKQVAAAIAAGPKSCALFLTARLGLIEMWARDLRPDIVHLGAFAGVTQCVSIQTDQALIVSVSSPSYAFSIAPIHASQLRSLACGFSPSCRSRF
jgi:hypothetical protein